MAPPPPTMSSKKFAHWNMFPFMTTPRAKYYSAQLQSPLLRMPREIRDLIYDYYVLEKEGYFYDSETRKMLYQHPSVTPKQTVRLGLMITCRIAAEEMKDISFQKINFSARCSVDDGSEYMELRSRAGRLKCLLWYVERQRRRMLTYVAVLLQHEDFVDLFSHYPTVKHRFQGPLRRAIAQNTNEFDDTDDHNTDQNLSQAFSEAVQYALDLAKKRNPPKFAEFACRVFGTGDCPIRQFAFFFTSQCNLFVQGAVSEIYSWRPTPWCIPEDSELSKLEALLCQPGDSDYQMPETDEGVCYFPGMTAHFQAQNTRWHFSATAVAIDYLQRLSKKQRRNMRTMIINEDSKAVSRPVCHARGLVPFCVENPELRIERHIGLLANLLPGRRWLYVDRLSIEGAECLEAMLPWIEAALLLPTSGMPLQSFQLVIEGASRESSEMWEVLKYAAAMQEALLEVCRRRGIRPKLRPNEPADYIMSLGPWNLPVVYSQSIRDIMEGKSIIRYDGDVGGLWDQDTFFLERKDWTLRQWEEEWKRRVYHYEIPTQFWRQCALRYQIQPEGYRYTTTILRNGQVIRT